MPTEVLPNNVKKALAERELSLNEGDDGKLYLLPQEDREKAIEMAVEAKDSGNPLAANFKKLSRKDTDWLKGLGKKGVSIVMIDGVPFALLDELGKGAAARAKIAQNLLTGEWVAAKTTLYDPDELKQTHSNLSINQFQKYPTQPSELRDRLTRMTPDQVETAWKTAEANEREMAALHFGNDKVKGALRTETKDGKTYHKSYLFMPLGVMSLGAKLSDHNRFSAMTEADALQYSEALLDELVVMQQKKIVHNDIKTANVVIGVDGKPKVMDFGAAYILGNPRGFAAYSPGWAAKERLESGGKTATHASDVYSMGLVLADIYGFPVIYDVPEKRNGATELKLSGTGERFISPETRMKMWPLIAAMVNSDPTKRPTAEQAKEMLAKIKQGADLDTTVVLPPELQTSVRDRSPAAAPIPPATPVTPQLLTTDNAVQLELLKRTQAILVDQGYKNIDFNKLTIKPDPTTKSMVLTGQTEQGRNIRIRVYADPKKVTLGVEKAVADRIESIQDALADLLGRAGFDAGNRIFYSDENEKLEKKILKLQKKHLPKDPVSYVANATKNMKAYCLAVAAELNRQDQALGLNRPAWSANTWLAQLQAVESDMISHKKREVLVNIYKTSASDKIDVPWTIDCVIPKTDMPSNLRWGKDDELPNHYDVISETVKIKSDGTALAQRTAFSRSASLAPIAVTDDEERRNAGVRIAKKHILDNFDAAALTMHQDILTSVASGSSDLAKVKPKRVLVLTLFSAVADDSKVVDHFDKGSPQLRDTSEVIERLQTDLKKKIEGLIEGIKLSMIATNESERRENPAELTDEQEQLLEEYRNKFEKTPPLELAHINFGVNALRGFPTDLQKKVNLAGLEQQLLGWFLEDNPTLTTFENKQFEQILKDWKSEDSVRKPNGLRQAVRARSASQRSQMDFFAGLMQALSVESTNVLSKIVGADRTDKYNYMRPIFTGLLAQSLGVDVHVTCQSGEDRTGVYFALVDHAKAVLLDLQEEDLNFSLANEKDFRKFVDVFWKESYAALLQSTGLEITGVNVPGARGYQTLVTTPPVLPFRKMNDPNTVENTAELWDAQGKMARRAYGIKDNIVQEPKVASRDFMRSRSSNLDRTLSPTEMVLSSFAMRPLGPEPSGDSHHSDIASPAVMGRGGDLEALQNLRPSDDDVLENRTHTSISSPAANTILLEATSVAFVTAEPSANVSLQALRRVLINALHDIPSTRGSWEVKPGNTQPSENELVLEHFKAELRVTAPSARAVDFELKGKQNSGDPLSPKDKAQILARSLYAAWASNGYKGFKLDRLEDGPFANTLVEELVAVARAEGREADLQNKLKSVTLTNGQKLSKGDELLNNFFTPSTTLSSEH